MARPAHNNRACKVKCLMHLFEGLCKEPHHTPYDLDRAAELIRGSRDPQAHEFATHNVLAPPTAAEAIATFEHMAAQRSRP